MDAHAANIEEELGNKLAEAALTDRGGLTMRCRSGKHEWLDPVSASRCCHPDWSRELRSGMSDRVPGDADDGVQVISGGGGWCWVWHWLPADEIEDS